MREWKLEKALFPNLILAADARLSPLNYFDDQIWGLTIQGGEPAALALRTTYGLRARSMRLFPRFTEGDSIRSNPAKFAAQPVVHRFYPNYLLGTFSPFEGIDVIFEYWAAQSNAIAGRLRVRNGGVTPRKINLEWIALLIPGAEGQRMTPAQIESVNVLRGMFSGLAPVVFLTGGPKALNSPYPCLSVNMDLLPGLDRTLTWVHAALPEAQDSFALAREIAAKNWDAEFARIELSNAARVEITTGNPDWDAALVLGQKTAMSLVHGPTEHLPHLSFVRTRQADQGFSLRGDGSDYNHLWNGQTGLETWHLCQQLLLTAPEIAKGLLKNFLSQQAANGHIPWKVGLTGKNSKLLATPLLCHLAWEIYQATDDQAFLEEVFLPLRNFISAWFGAANDRDIDGIPEWEHPLQSGFDDNPIFAHWQTWSQGADITLFESPALCAFLYNECRSLIKMALALGDSAPIQELEITTHHLREVLAHMWDEKKGTYHYIDRDTHYSSSGKTLGRRKGTGTLHLNRFVFEEPARLLVYIQPPGESSRETEFIIHGTNATGQKITEHLPPEKTRWSFGTGTGISREVYTAVETLEVINAQPEDKISVHTVDFQHQDQTNLLPLWAKIPTKDEASSLIKKHIMKPNRYWKPFGLPACPKTITPEAATSSKSVWITWNSLIGMGLVNYGHRELAAELVGRLLDAIAQNLHTNGTFRRHYHAETGAGIGERNELNGLPPLTLFLYALGVRLYSPWKIRLQGENPFPWPVKIKYRGLSIHRDMQETKITFPSGETVTITDPAACVVNGRYVALM